MLPGRVKNGTFLKIFVFGGLFYLRKRGVKMALDGLLRAFYGVSPAKRPQKADPDKNHRFLAQ
jgi:hypothetical protein